MRDRIDRPQELRGTTQDQIRQLWRYIWELSALLNERLDGIGSNELTDEERKVMNSVLQESTEKDPAAMISMKDMIVQTAAAISRLEARVSALEE